MSNLLILYGIVFVFLIFVNCHGNQCRNTAGKTSPSFYLLANCHRSKLKTSTQSDHMSLDECKQLAHERRGMAFNFSPLDKISRRSVSEDNLKSCIVLSCPEVENSTSLVYDKAYDYYSIFSYPIPPVNSSCLDGIGVFFLQTSPKENYTKAQDTCKDLGFVLADVATDARTNGLSFLVETLLSTGAVKQVYVGMDDKDNEGHFIRSNGESLTCTTYRAWAPGHPKYRHPHQDCVTIDSKIMWRVLECDIKMAFLCEMYPKGRDIYYVDIYEPVVNYCLDYEILFEN